MQMFNLTLIIHCNSLDEGHIISEVESNELHLLALL